MIMSENIDITAGPALKLDPASAPHQPPDRCRVSSLASLGSLAPTQPQDGAKHGDNDLIETDDELLEVGSNEAPDGSEEDDDDEDDDGDNSNLSRPLDFTTGRKLSDSDEDPCRDPRDERDTGPSTQPASQHTTKKKGVRSFCIDDILSHKTAALQRGGGQQGIVRPWAQDQDQPSDPPTTGRRKSTGDSPLDALFNMASNFEAMKAKSDMERAQMSFANKQPPKKKRKSRTAFTNHQIFELEKRFLYQKYLSPADRDEIAATLGLSNAQVICWFQNRRAKFKRDMEELKKDVEKTSQAGPGQPGHSPGPRPPPPPALGPGHPALPPGLSFPPPPGLGLQHPGHPGLAPHPHLILQSLAPHLLPASLASPQPRSPPSASSSPPIRVEDSD